MIATIAALVGFAFGFGCAVYLAGLGLRKQRAAARNDAMDVIQ